MRQKTSTEPLCADSLKNIDYVVSDFNANFWIKWKGSRRLSQTSLKLFSVLSASPLRVLSRTLMAWNNWSYSG